MATGGKVPGRLLDSAGSEHLSLRICQPCLEKDKFVDATGLCVDCQDYLCLKCFDDHNGQQHRLLDREHILHGQTQAKTDSCSVVCPVHENEVIQYNCAIHVHLGYKSCINLEHATCDEVHYIPRVSIELTNNEDYRQVEIWLKSTLDTFMNVLRNAQRNFEEVDKSCTYALRRLQEFKRQMVETFDKIECELVEDMHILKSQTEQYLSDVRNKYKGSHKDLQSQLAKIELLQNANQNCNFYIEMMKTKAKIKSVEDQIQQAKVDVSYRPTPIQFTKNKKVLEILRNPDGFGTVSSAGTHNVLSGSDEVTVLPDTDTENVLFWGDDFTIISDTESISQPSLRRGGILSVSDFATLDYQINLKTERDKSCCRITGMVLLPDNRLVLTDDNNSSLKAVDVHTGKVVPQLGVLESPSLPWDITFIKKNKVAVTLPYAHYVAFVTVGDNLSITETLAVSGKCWGVDYRNGKLAVAFTDPRQVQILNMQGLCYLILSIKTCSASPITSSLVKMTQQCMCPTARTTVWCV